MKGVHWNLKSDFCCGKKYQLSYFLLYLTYAQPGSEIEETL